MIPTFKRILVPTDFSAHSDAAVRYAVVLARQFGSSLFLLHVLDDAYAAGPWESEFGIPETPGLRDRLKREAEQRLTACLTAADRDRFNVTTEVVTGRPAQSIVDFARDNATDLIVMGTHGRSGVAHLLMGSVAERVVRSAPCPVLTVRADAETMAEAFDAELAEVGEGIV